MSFTTTDLQRASEQMSTMRDKTAKILDAYYAELESMIDKISKCPSSSELWGYRDRFEEIRAAIYKLTKSTLRNISSAREVYEDRMRESMARVKNTGGLHFSEREAGYQIKNIDAYKILTNLERSLEDLKVFTKYLEGRLQWMKDRQRWLLEKEKGI